MQDSSTTVLLDVPLDRLFSTPHVGTEALVLVVSSETSLTLIIVHSEVEGDCTRRRTVLFWPMVLKFRCA